MTAASATAGAAIKELIARTRILDAIRERLTSADGITHLRKTIAEYLRDYSRNLEADIKKRRERVKRTEDKIAGWSTSSPRATARSTS